MKIIFLFNTFFKYHNEKAWAQDEIGCWIRKPKMDDLVRREIIKFEQGL